MREKVLLNFYRVFSILAVVALAYAYRGEISRLIGRLSAGKESEVNVSVETEAETSEPGSAVETETVKKPAHTSNSYFDERKPDYSLINTYTEDPVTIEFTWTSFEGLYYATICYTIDEKLYTYFRSLSRYYGNDEYVNYIDDPINDKYIEMIVENLDTIAGKRDYTDGERVREAIAFCQSFEYETDNDTTDHMEWPKYPVELLYDRTGDCEDSAILMVGILRKMGYGCALIKFDDHIAVGLKGDDSLNGSYYDYEGEKYYYVETTNKGWYIGEIPDEYKNLEATLIPIN